MNTLTPRHPRRALLTLLVATSLAACAADVMDELPDDPATAVGGKADEGTVTPLHATIRVQAVAVSDERGGRPTLITPREFSTYIDAVNLAFNPHGIRFVFDAATDWASVQSYSLNSITLAPPPGYPSRILPDSHGRALRVAAAYPGKLVVILRHGAGAAGYDGESFSSGTDPFVMFRSFSQTGNGALLAHEIGHYLGLSHTHARDDLATGGALLAELNAAGGDMSVFDGDGLSDTLPDPSPAWWRTMGYDPCGPVREVTINVVRPRRRTVRIRPDRSNVMSYFMCSPGTASPQQVSRVLGNLASPLRQHLSSYDPLAPQPIANAWGQCLRRTPPPGGVWRSDGGPFTTPHVRACDGSVDERWLFTAAGEIRVGNGQSLCISENGGRIYTERCDGSARQRWTRTVEGLLRNEQGTCLRTAWSEEPGSQPAAGAEVVADRCEAVTHNRWWSVAAEIVSRPPPPSGGGRY